MAELLPEMLATLEGTSGQGHHNFVHMMVHGANAHGAGIVLANRNA
eukprot:CAMPEP_0196808146 /NCGR_PEP_ID=MMETSP1362-20130617/8134_1 /TAXON_ID=163516 /ORGANISM="Leptocylindrus danicus, Strain CCMP1856" /LENGTH=45 /DNA_ID= /DNA_START= /DNA_END= /DNA_ORIENTATION=